MTTTTRAPATRPQAKLAEPITFDERLALASLAVDARINTQPLNLADIIRHPVETPVPAAPCPYRTPLAALLHRAKVRLERDGWCKGQLRDGARACLIGHIRTEAASRGQADDACAVLLEAIRRDFRDAETVASWNDAQRGPRFPLLYLGRAAELAHARNL